MTSALIAYTPPPAVARALAARGYTSLQLEAHAAAMARRARMMLARRQEVKEAPKPAPAPRAPQELPSGSNGWPPSPVQIVKIDVAAHFGLTVAEINSSSRKWRIVFPRMVAMWIYHQARPQVGEPQIGRVFAHPNGDRSSRSHVRAACVQAGCGSDQVRRRICIATQGADGKHLGEDAGAGRASREGARASA
jgi:Bacterial dnaA protein helix-turn-helix